jgi:hypothetical protein
MPTGLWLYAWIGLWVLVLLEGVMLCALLRQVTGLYEYWVKGDPDHGPKLGSIAPHLPERGLHLRPLPPESGRWRLIFFFSRECGACKRTLKIVPDFAARADLSVVLVVGNSEEQTEEFLEGRLAESAVAKVALLADAEKNVFGDFGVTTTPYAVVVDRNGRIGAKGIVNEIDEVDRLIRQSDGRRELLKPVSRA